MSDPKFSSVEWGSDEAKNDIRLSNYFVDIPGFKEVIEGSKRYVIGRKGTGKTAVCQIIRNTAENLDPTWFTSDLSLKNFPIQVIKEMKDKSFADKSQYVAIWTYLLLVEFATLVAKDGSVKGVAGEEIRRFLSDNYHGDGYGMAKTLNILQQKSKKVSILSKWLSASGSKTDSKTANVEIDYHKASQLLSDKLKKIFSESRYFVLMDELDEGYSAGDQGIRLLLLALIRASENVARDLAERGAAYRPILVLRSDIFDSLEDNDLNKLEDHIIRLKWFTDPGQGCCLLDVVNARIKNSVEIHHPQNPWTMVTEDAHKNLPRGTTSTWAYICSRTFQRPRDVIQFLKKCRDVGVSGKLTYPIALNAEVNYSDWLYRELRDEMQSHLPVWKQAFACVQKLGVGRFPVQKYCSELSSDPEIARWLSGSGKRPEDIAKFMFSFGVLGTVDSRKRWLFSYKDQDCAFDDHADLIVHFGIMRKLRIFPYLRRRKPTAVPKVGVRPSRS